MAPEKLKRAESIRRRAGVAVYLVWPLALALTTVFMVIAIYY